MFLEPFYTDIIRRIVFAALLYIIDYKFSYPGFTFVKFFF